MKNIFLSLIAFVLLIVMSCGRDDPEPKNSPPNAFTVTVSNVGINQADISWTAPEDSDGDEVSYDVSLEGQSVTTITGQEAGSTITITINGLTDATEYSGVVTADDGKKDGTTEALYSFTTVEIVC